MHEANKSLVLEICHVLGTKVIWYGCNVLKTNCFVISRPTPVVDQTDNESQAEILLTLQR